jgi:hypothetical protein
MKLWRGQPDNWKWKPSARDVARLWLGLAACFFVLGYVAWESPSNSSSTGRWSWLKRIAFDLFGPNGDAILFAAVGTTCLIAALLKYRTDEQTGL